MPSPEMQGTAVLISIQCRCNLTSKGCLCHGKQGTSESISPWKRIIIFQTIPGFRALFGRILVRTGFSTFFAKLQLFAIQVCLFTCLAVIEKGATSSSLSPDWPSCIISASRISARQLGTALAALAIHTSMEILPSSCPFNSFRSRFVGIYALGR